MTSKAPATKAGLILINKPKGPTSAQISVWVKNLVNAKAGHCGTLDPQVSGVLPVLVGKGVKLLEFLQEHDKEYICIMQLEKTVTEKQIRDLFKEFTGKIHQRPPEMSAVAKNIRIRNIYYIDFLEMQDNVVLFKVKCQHGTYIRTLVEDFGKILGQKTQMAELRRTTVNGFKEDECITMTQLKDKVVLNKLDTVLLPLEEAVRSLPKAVVKGSASKMLQHGTPLMAPGLIELKGHIVKDSPVAIFNEQKQLVGVAKSLYSSTEINGMKKGKIMSMRKVLI